MFSIRELIDPLPRITIVDVGASPLDGQPPYQRLLDLNTAHVIGFEPNPEQFAALQARGDAQHVFLPYAIGDGQEATLNLYHASGMSSLLPANMEVLDYFHGFEEWCKPVGSKSIQTHRLDDIAEIEAMDYLKLDVQGSELAVLKGATEKLASTLVIHTETQFIPIYQDQPLFSDLDAFLRQSGFYLHCFHVLRTRAFKPVIVKKSLYAGLNQAFEADVVYVKQFTDFAQLSASALIKIAIIAHELYRSYDLAALALRHVDRKAESQLQRRYLKRLSR
jgi:FkbM family methyltransferase